MIVNRNSWHFWILRKTIGDYRANNIEDSCEYIRSVIWSCLSTAIMGTFLSITLVVLIASMIYFWVAIVGFIAVIDTDMLSVGAVLNVAVLIFGGLILYDRYDYRIGSFFRKFKKQNLAVEQKSPGFFVQAKDRIKNKFCSKVEIVDTEYD